MTENTMFGTWRSWMQPVDVRMIIILLLGSISFTTVTITIPWDLLGYMTHALNILNGQGYSYIDGQPVLFRGPVFSLLIALSFKLFGVSPESAFNVVRLFCIANPVLLYFFGKKLFNANVGLVAALLILTSYSMSYWSYRHLDAVWPFFIILHCYLLYVGFEKKNLWFFVVAGFFLGIGYLTKEVALLFFPLGSLMLLWIKEYRTKRNLKYIVISLLALGVTISPWVLYLWQHDRLHFLWGSGGPRVLGDMEIGRSEGVGLVDTFIQALGQYISAFFAFYSAESKNTVAANFTIAPLFLFTWVFIACKAFFGDKKSKILVLNIFLFLPIIYFIGKNHWRFGQVLHTMLVSYLALSFMLFSIVEWFVKRLKKPVVLIQITFFIFAAVILSVQSFSLSASGFRYKKFFRNSMLLNLVKGERNNIQVKGGYSDSYLEKIIEKLMDVSNIEDGIIVNFWDNAKIIFMKTDGKRKLFVVPYILCNENFPIDLKTSPQIVENDKAIILWSLGDPEKSKFSVYIVLKKQLDKIIKERNIRYVIQSPFYPAYNQYFSTSENFELIFESGPVGNKKKFYYLYKVKEKFITKDNDNVYISKHLRKSLEILKEKMPDKYYYFYNELSSKYTGLSTNDLTKALKN